MILDPIKIPEVTRNWKAEPSKDDDINDRARGGGQDREGLTFEDTGVCLERRGRSWWGHRCLSRDKE